MSRSSGLAKNTLLKVANFRRMDDTEWFESKSVDEKLTHLSQLINSPEANAKAEFKTLLNFVPVELVTTLNDFELSCSQKRRLSK